MSLTDGRAENQAGARPIVAACTLAAFVIAVILFHSDIQAFFSSHSWWQDALALLAGIAVPVLAYFELRHSGEANELRREANEHRDMANRLQRRVAELEEEKAKHLAQIAANTQRPQTQADINAAIFRKHLRARVSVSEEKGVWSDAPQIVEVNSFLLETSNGKLASSIEIDYRAQGFERNGSGSGGSKYPIFIR